MKVLLINNRHFRGGGADVVYFSTSDLLASAGHEPTFFSFHLDKAEPYCKDSYFAPDNNLFNILKQTRLYFNNTEAAKALDNLLSEEHFDIAHAHLMWGGLSAAIIPVLHKHGIPLVHTVHDYRMVCPAYTFRNGRGEVCEKCKGGHFMECFKNRCSKGKTLESFLMASEIIYRNRKWHPAKTLDGIIYVSKFAKEKHEEIDPLFEGTLNIVLYNFTTLGEKFPLTEKDEGYYLYYGRLSGEKGIDTLLSVFARHPELKLKVVGSGPKEDELKSKGYSNVEFLGFKNGQELFNLVRNAKYVCVPSEWYENNPMTIVEAYSMGVPVIGARIGGIPEIVVEGKTGFLFDSGNTESLEKAIENSLAITGKDYLQMKHQAKAFADNHFNKDVYVKRLVDFYNEVIADYNRKNK